VELVWEVSVVLVVLVVPVQLKCTPYTQLRWSSCH
jgi:hypothetical protein